MSDLITKLAILPFATVRAAFIERSRIEAGRRVGGRDWMLNNGFELLDIPDDRLLTDDGREVLRAHGKTWALRPEIHAQRLAEAMELAKQRVSASRAGKDAGPPKPTACHAIIDGQFCGGELVTSVVCPRCALGKHGVAATLTCDVCGHVTGIMRGDS